MESVASYIERGIRLNDYTFSAPPGISNRQPACSEHVPPKMTCVQRSWVYAKLTEPNHKFARYVHIGNEGYDKRERVTLADKLWTSRSAPRNGKRDTKTPFAQA
jgi:hypothetical protein